jgi:hypothetical protein
MPKLKNISFNAFVALFWSVVAVLTIAALAGIGFDIYFVARKNYFLCGLIILLLAMIAWQIFRWAWARHKAKKEAENILAEWRVKYRKI